jgi:enoyl-CoA hydratase
VDAAVELAELIAANGPLAVAATKQIVQSVPAWSPDEMWDRQDEVVRPVFASEDAREGSTAFAERRPPVWRGR